MFAQFEHLELEWKNKLESYDSYLYTKLQKYTVEGIKPFTSAFSDTIDTISFEKNGCEFNQDLFVELIKNKSLIETIEINESVKIITSKIINLPVQMDTLDLDDNNKFINNVIQIKKIIGTHNKLMEILHTTFVLSKKELIKQWVIANYHVNLSEEIFNLQEHKSFEKFIETITQQISQQMRNLMLTTQVNKQDLLEKIYEVEKNITILFWYLFSNEYIYIYEFEKNQGLTMGKINECFDRIETNSEMQECVECEDGKMINTYNQIAVMNETIENHKKEFEKELIEIIKQTEQNQNKKLDKSDIENIGSTLLNDYVLRNSQYPDYDIIYKDEFDVIIQLIILNNTFDKLENCISHITSNY